jgi:hypothetical protein
MDIEIREGAPVEPIELPSLPDYGPILEEDSHGIDHGPQGSSSQ